MTARRETSSPVAALLAALEATRARTLELIAPLHDAVLTTQHSALMSPLVWDLGHIAEFEAQWLVPAHLDSAAVRLYDAMATPRADRSKLTLPPTAAVLARLGQVRRAVHEANGSAELPAGDFSWALVVQHELQHQETMLQAIALREDVEYRPRFVASAEPPRAGDAGEPRVFIPGGVFTMGTDDREWAYDNERPAHPRHVEDFYMARSPVNNGAYLAFMNDGGYLRPELWSQAGWAWVERTRCHAPGHWVRAEDAEATSLHGWMARVFGRLEPLAAAGLVSHVSWYEADAFARWAGGRLPTEAEWEKAAAWEPLAGHARRYPWGDAPWVETRANLGQSRLEPAFDDAYPAGQSAYGCLQMLGDVWEWTSTWFAGYPGFQSFPYAEYSEVFFGDQYRVLRGGAFATSPLVARNTFRNWDFPERRQIFAGFRCAWPA